MATIDELLKTRLEKLKNLEKLGINPYPPSVIRSNSIIQARESKGKKVKITGRILAIRGHGKLIFFDLNDESGKVQVAMKANDIKPETFKLVAYLDIGDFIAVSGKVGQTVAGEITVFASDFQIITKSVRPLPDKWHGLKDIEERYRKRYLDTILNKEVKDRFRKRSEIITAMRNFMDSKGFIEVETPTLQPVYGGGFARPFSTHHNALDANFYLRISDEMYLKRLIVGGFEKVYEITKVFRNEGIDLDHNPEFTMFEAQIAYEDYTYGMDIIEEIIENVAQKVLGLSDFIYQGEKMSVKRPWPRMKMVEAIEKFTKINTLKWKTLDEAKRDIIKLFLSDDKKPDLNKILSLGEAIAFIFEEFVEEKLIQPTIIYDYPIEVSPLAKKCTDSRFTQRFEMFAFGSELGNNYTELNDPIDLKRRFIEEKKREEAGFEEAHQTDYDYLEAIEHGFPPTCGIAIGIDRLVMMFTNAKSIKEVIAFPTLKPLREDYKNITTQKLRLPEEKVNKINDKKVNLTERSLKMTRQQAWELVTTHMQNQNLRRHCLAVEAAMRGLAKYFHGNEELWGIVGLLHDSDYELTKNDTSKHAHMAAGWLKEIKADQAIIDGVLAHGWRFVEGCPEPKDNLEWSIYTGDELTGLIVAVALVRPDKKLSSVTVDSVMGKWNNKNFAAGANRDQIKLCEEKLGIKLPDFIKIILESMQGVSNELGL